MDSVLRAGATYVFVWLVFRIAGKRTLAEITTFDFVLLLIISETAQAALIDNDNSMTNSFLLISTMLALDIGLSLLKQRSKWAEKVMDGLPLVVVDQGQLQNERMERERIDEEDVLSAARESHGLARLDQIEYAVLEKDGVISIIPRQEHGAEKRRERSDD